MFCALQRLRDEAARRKSGLVMQPSAQPLRATPRAVWRSASIGLALPVLAVGLVLTAMFLYFAIISISTTTPITYPEGAHVAAILRIRAGEPL